MYRNAISFAIFFCLTLPAAEKTAAPANAAGKPREESLSPERFSEIHAPLLAPNNKEASVGVVTDRVARSR